MVPVVEASCDRTKTIEQREASTGVGAANAMGHSQEQEGMRTPINSSHIKDVSASLHCECKDTDGTSLLLPFIAMANCKQLVGPN